MATTTNYGWTTPDDTALVKDGAAAIRTLGSSVDTTTKNLNPETTLGDIAYRSSTANIKTRLGLGTAGQVLQVNSGATAPEWATLTSGGLTLISEQTPSGVSSLSFTSIPSTFKQLVLVWSGVRHNTTGSTFAIRFNNNSGSVYNHYFVGMNDGSYSTRDAVNTYVGDSLFPPFGLSNSQATIRRDALGTIVVDNYASSTRPKYIRGGWTGNNEALGQGKWTNYSGIFDDTTAITSVNIVRISGSETFSTVNNSSIRLYGLS